MKHYSMKIVSLLLILVLLIATAVPAFAKKKNYPNGAYRVVMDEPDMRLNVHDTPKSGRDNVIKRLDQGTVVLFQYTEKGWWNVQWWDGHDDLRDGYVDGSFLVAVDADPTVEYTCVDNTYIHSTPNITEGDCSYYHIDKLMVGTKVHVLSQKSTWSFVSYNDGFIDVSGWIPSKYLIQA